MTAPKDANDLLRNPVSASKFRHGHKIDGTLTSLSAWQAVVETPMGPYLLCRRTQSLSLSSSLRETSSISAVRELRRWER